MSFAVAAAIFQGVSSLASASMKQDALAQESQRAQQNNAAVQAEYTRQQQAVADQAAQGRSDRMRQAEKELGLARVSSAEGLGSITNAAYKDVAYTAGLDLSRINTNMGNQINSIQSSKSAAARRASDQIASNTAASDAAGIGGLLGAAGAGLTYGAKTEARRQDEERQKNKTSLAGAYNFLNIDM